MKMNTTNDFTFKRSATTSISPRECKNWFGSNEPLFSVFQTIILLAFSIPANFNITKYSNKFLVIFGYAIGLIWINYRSNDEWIYGLDSIINWYSLFLLINGVQLIYMFVQRFFNKIPQHLVELFSSVFQPLGVAPRDFLDLVKLGTIKYLPANHRYSSEGSTRIGQSISILLTGSLQVTFNRILIHTIEPNEFVDSVEFKYQSCYFNKTSSSSLHQSVRHHQVENLQHEDNQEETSFVVPEGDDGKYLLPREFDKFQVSITAIESSKIITWDIESFVDLLETRDRLKSVVYAFIGKDVIHKIYGQ